jgi:hypothetical protein
VQGILRLPVHSGTALSKKGAKNLAVRSPVSSEAYNASQNIQTDEMSKKTDANKRSNEVATAIHVIKGAMAKVLGANVTASTTFESKTRGMFLGSG